MASVNKVILIGHLNKDPETRCLSNGDAVTNIIKSKQPPFFRLHSNIELTNSGCWEWKGLKMSSGYGHLKVFGKFVGAHRLSYELYKGQIPIDKEIMHLCDNRLCVNPDHLKLGTHKENMLDMVLKGRKKSGIRNILSKPVFVLGKAYGSMNEAEKELGLGSGTVSYWIKNVPKKAICITREEYLEILNDIG